MRQRRALVLTCRLRNEIVSVRANYKQVFLIASSATHLAINGTNAFSILL